MGNVSGDSVGGCDPESGGPLHVAGLYSRIFDISPDSFAVVDSKGVILLVNLKAAETFGFADVSSAVGRGAMDFVSPEDRQRLGDNLRTVLAGGVVAGHEYSFLRVDGSSFKGELTVSLVSGGVGGSLFVIVIRDLTYVKSVERELVEYATTLEDLVAERTRQLEVEKNRVQELLNQKTQFVNQLSHDLRTPLTPILNMLPLIEEGLTDEKERKRFRLVMRNVDYINDLAVSTLTLARLDSGTVSFDMKPVGLRSLVEGVLENNRSMLDKAGITPVNGISAGVKVFGDGMRLMEVLNNLIGNALKYAPGGGLRFGAEDSSGFVMVSVSDDGIGVPPEKLHNLFTEFYKVDTSRHDLSSGLGLAICRRIVGKHGGRIWAESEGSGRGTTFKFTLQRV